jgi:quercetin dioxygenase-like cupin family protein
LSSPEAQLVGERAAHALRAMDRSRGARTPPRPTTEDIMQPRSLASLRAALAATLTVPPLCAAHADEPGRVTDLMTRELSNVPGKEVTMITVDYSPGAADPVHRHDASAFIYVIEGTIEMQMEGGEMVTLKPGQTFYEEPRRVHAVGRNPSDTEPAKFVVFLVKDKDTPILESIER